MIKHLKFGKDVVVEVVKQLHNDISINLKLAVPYFQDIFVEVYDNAKDKTWSLLLWFHSLIIYALPHVNEFINLVILRWKYQAAAGL